MQVFSAQQTPHRVQSSTNLDLVDCVGSDLLLAMNNLDVSEQQARACANLVNNGCHHDLLEGGPGAGSPPHPHPPPPGDGGFLPLAALAPPPARQPSWLTAQQLQARVQNEHFPSSSRGSLYGCDSGEEGGGADGGGTHHRQLRSSSCGGVVMGGGRLDDDDSSRQQQAYPPGSNGNNNSSWGGPGALPPPGFGLDSCSSVGSWNGSTNSSTNNSAAAAVAAAAARLRRPCSSSSNGGNPHLDESWTAVLNAPAGAELMEFLTERPSRALVLWNVEAIGEDELRAACEEHGPLYYLRAEHRRKRVIFVAYYDVRDAVNAHRSLGAELSKYLMDEVCTEVQFFVGGFAFVFATSTSLFCLHACRSVLRSKLRFVFFYCCCLLLLSRWLENSSFLLTLGDMPVPLPWDDDCSRPSHGWHRTCFPAVPLVRTSVVKLFFVTSIFYSSRFPGMCTPM